MKMNSINKQTIICASSLLLAVCVLTGCKPSPVGFPINRVYVKTIELQKAKDEYTYKREDLKQVKTMTRALFGTPDEPRVPEKLKGVLDVDKLRFAAGPVKTDENGFTISGLYRRHCVHCHGINGGGNGPTAPFLNPYPRDFRMGLIKFKTTPGRTPPTDADIKRILIKGVPGTAMPTFKPLLSLQEIDALVAYVKYLSIRGQAERMIIKEVPELEKGQQLTDTAVREKLLEELDSEITQQWKDAPSTIVAPYDLLKDHKDQGQADKGMTPEILSKVLDNEEMISRGRKLFKGSGGCVQCHGEAQIGDGQLVADLWTKELKDQIDQVKDKDLEKEYLAVGALPIRISKPRNLRSGIFRGGRRPVDLYYRIYNGIIASEMPSVAGIVSEKDVWALVAYLRSLPKERINNPYKNVPTNQAEVGR